MNTIVFRVLMGAMGLYMVDLFYAGFAFGFPVFVALSASTVALLWVYHRLVIRRVRPVQNWRWERFGSQLIRMEVA